MDADENEHPLELVVTAPNQKTEHTLLPNASLEETLTINAPPDDFVILNF